MLSPEQKEAKKDRALKGIVRLATKAIGKASGTDNGKTGRAKGKTTKARPKARRASTRSVSSASA